MAIFYFCDGCPASRQARYVPPTEYTEAGHGPPLGDDGRPWRDVSLSDYAAHACSEACEEKIKTGERSLTPTTDSGKIRLPVWRTAQ